MCVCLLAATQALSMVKMDFFVYRDFGCTYFNSPTNKIVCRNLQNPEIEEISERLKDYMAEFDQVRHSVGKKRIWPNDTYPNRAVFLTTLVILYGGTSFLAFWMFLK